MASQNRIDYGEASDLTVFYIFRGDISEHALLNSLITDKAVQKKYRICYSKTQDAFLGAKNDIDKFIDEASLVLEDTDREDVSDEEFDKEIAIYKNSLVDYLECDWEGFDLALNYGMGKDEKIELSLSDQAESALDTIINFEWLLNVDDWYTDITRNTKEMMFSMVMVNLRQSFREVLNLDNAPEIEE